MKNIKYKIPSPKILLSIFLIVELFFVQQALAQGGSGGYVSGGGSRDQVQDRDRIQDPTTHDGDEPVQDRDRLQDRDQLQNPTIGTTTPPNQDQLRKQDRDRVQDPTTHEENEPLQDRDQLRDQDRDRVHIDLENVTTTARNTQQLRATIENRERELNQEATSTAAQHREIIQNQNRIRLAIHTIYASEDLLGPIGQQAKQIAEQINYSVQKTVNAEAEINARGFWNHILFGGDSINVRILQQEQEQNILRIQDLKKLINEAIISPEVQITLMEQIRIMEEEQARLAQLAKKESRQWGIFSWRF